MGTIDLATLLLVLFAGAYLGLLGALGFDLIQWVNPSWRIPIYDVVGIAALWQLSRQRF